MKIVTIVGARPQFVKAAVLSRLFLAHPDFEEVLIHTGQHFDSNMSDVFFKEMEIPHPHYSLGINGLGHGAMTGQMLEKIEGVLLKEKPDWVLLYGDTNSTLAGSLAAAKLNIKIAHVEAGLRSFNMRMPEEINRILTDRISTLLFCPTQNAIINLEKEGYKSLQVKTVYSGDIMEDAAYYYEAKAEQPKEMPSNISEFILVTIHRAENTDNPARLKSIFSALKKIAQKNTVILPLHPRTKALIEKQNINTGNIHMIDPVGYLNMIWLIKKSRLVMTDSGGLQKEAYFFNKYCITLRDETEWMELVNCNFNVLAGSDENKILGLFDQLKDKKFSNKINLYGGGNAAKIIIDNLINFCL
jgi:UDP-GlcNAc3NAcA epimerase